LISIKKLSLGGPVWYTLLMNQIIFFCGSYLIFVACAVTPLFLLKKDRGGKVLRDIIFVFGVATTSWVIAHVLKGIIAHPRPDIVGALIKPDDTYSFQ
jgi:hypothetical protein